jgi:hypothetical protein
MKPPKSLIALAMTIAVVLSGCVTGVRVDDPSAVDRKFALSSYIEEGKLVALVVGTRPARISNCQGYMPLEIGIANKGLKSLSLTPESFTLIDSAGSRYPMVYSKELYEHYGRVDTDRRLGEVLPVLRAKFQAYAAVPSNFTPSFDRPMDRRRLYLPRYSFTYDLIYFPCPGKGIRGQVFELFMTAPELPDPVFVRFEVGGAGDDSER